jgi:aryl-alcohol dehydrogenase-like predicted oxidoreductase
MLTSRHRVAADQDVRRDNGESSTATCVFLAIVLVFHGWLAAGERVGFPQDTRAGATPAQIALAWLLSKGDDMCRSPGPSEPHG